MMAFTLQLSPINTRNSVFHRGIVEVYPDNSLIDRELRKACSQYIASKDGINEDATEGKHVCY